MVKESRHELGADGRPGQQSTADDFGSQQFAAGLGTVRIERKKSGEHFRPVRTAFWSGQALDDGLPAEFESKLIGGWQLNGIGTFLSGFPFTPLVGSSRSGNGDTRIPDRPNVNTAFSGPVILGKPNEWFNPAAFSLPAFGTFGNVGRGSLNGPGLAEVDMSLVKDTVVTERIKMQFRAEVFQRVSTA